MAAIYDVEIDKRATWTLTVIYEDATGTPIPLTGYTARCQIRNTPGGSLLYLDLTPTITAAEGRVDVVATPTQTANMTFDRGFYDILLSSPSGTDKIRLLQGSVTIREAVTV